jgi:hypothetical protein
MKEIRQKRVTYQTKEMRGIHLIDSATREKRGTISLEGHRKSEKTVSYKYSSSNSSSF